MQLDFTLAIHDDAWYPTAELTHLTPVTGSTAEINKFVTVFFTGPGKVSAGDVSIESSPWIDFSVEVEQTEVGSGEFDTRLTVTAPESEQIGAVIQKIHIGLNKTSDLVPEWSTFEETFVAAADDMPDINGSVIIECASVPAGMESGPLEVVFSHGDSGYRLAAIPGQSTRYDLALGNYQLTVNDLVTADGTRRAVAHLNVQQIDIKQGESSRLQVTFGAVVESSTLDIMLDLSAFPELENEELEFSYAENSAEKQRFILSAGGSQRLEGLPVKGNFTLTMTALRLNNQQYKATAISGSLDGQLHTAIFNQQNVSASQDDVTGAVFLPLVINTGKTVADRLLSLRLIDRTTTVPRQYRLDAVPVKSGTFIPAIAVAPGVYQPQPQTFINDCTVHYVEPQAELTLRQGDATELNVNVEEGADLRVKGFPEFLTFGGCANMSPSNVDDFATARVSSIFKYSGDDGMGDAGAWLDPAKEPTSQVIRMARDVSAKLAGQSVLPMMVSYTCNLSLGDVEHIIADPVRHKFSFANYIQALKMAQSMKDAEHPVPAGFIVNPDYLGECQKTGLSPDYAIPVREPLAEAMAHHNVEKAIPAGITNTLKGYIRAVNWLTRVVAPDVVLGWQVNLWGVGGSQWVYNDFTYENAYNPATQKMEHMTFTPAVAGQKTAEYALLVGVFDDIDYQQADGLAAVAKGADFMAIDRYEADDYTIRSWANGYCYSPFEWDRTFEFAAAVSRHLKQPVLPWQFPASHLATEQDTVANEFDNDHWGTGGSYILGHAEIGSDPEAINEKLLDMSFNPSFAGMMGATPRELFSRHQWDMTRPRYVDFPSMGIFHVQLGGGATTGVVSAVGDTSSWVRNKLKAYSNAPVPFADKK
ncbi:hypothetical protein EGM70_19630 [Enterobacteriaceae bacterium 89]|nr:hypothetical protein [Enterobacteriaceae bacterium 89]